VNKENLKSVIIDQQEELELRLKKEAVVSREGLELCKKYIAYPNALLISGVRRAGKSFYSHLLAQSKKYAFLSFDDERLLELKSNDFNSVLECFYDLYGEFDFILFDEIQNVKGWELFINRLRNKYKIIITGSNANLMSKELATHLTGRFIDFTLFPLNFAEYLDFKGLKLSKTSAYSTKEKSEIIKIFNNYLFNSGFFEYYKFGKEFLRNLWRSIIEKDIIVRYGVRHPVLIEELALLLLNSFSCKVSKSNLARHLKIKSVNTVSDYMKYLENSFLIFTVNKFSFKIKEQLATYKKLYVMDNGFINSLGFNVSENRGRLLENLAAIELKRRALRDNFELYYWDDFHFECDFIIKKGKAVEMAYQVCTELTVNNRKRELDGLVAAMKEFKLKKGIILTDSTEEEIKIDAFKISVIPAWKWILGGL